MIELPEGWTRVGKHEARYLAYGRARYGTANDKITAEVYLDGDKLCVLVDDGTRTFTSGSATDIEIPLVVLKAVLTGEWGDV